MNLNNIFPILKYVNAWLPSHDKDKMCHFSWTCISSLYYCTTLYHRDSDLIFQFSTFKCFQAIVCLVIAVFVIVSLIVYYKDQNQGMNIYRCMNIFCLLYQEKIIWLIFVYSTQTWCAHLCFESQLLGLRYCWLIVRQCSNGSLPVRQCAYCPTLCDPESCSRGRDVCESKRKIPQRKRMAHRHPAWNKRWKYSAVSLFKPSRKTMTGKRIWEGAPV